MRKLLLGAAAIGVLSLGTVLPAEAARVATAHSDAYGTYLTNGNGRPLYLFTADTQGTGGNNAKIACDARCLNFWPLFTTQGKPQAGSAGVQASMLGSMKYDGKTVVTYHGWPLHLFVQDQGAKKPQGQKLKSFGGEWYLVAPIGEKAEKQNSTKGNGTKSGSQGGYY